MKKVFLHICTIVLAIVLWPFAITGAVSYFISGMRFNRWVSSGLSLCLAVTLRVTSGRWLIYLGEGAPSAWYFELLFGVINWALAAIFVSAFAQSIIKFREGWQTRATSSA